MTYRRVCMVICLIGCVTALAVLWTVREQLPGRGDLPGGTASGARSGAGQRISAVLNGDPLRFSVASMASVESTFFRYRNLMNRVARDAGMSGSFVLRSSYAELRRAIISGQVDIALVCTGPYVNWLESGGVDMLVRPELEESITYRSLLLVPASSAASGFADLKGQTVAFSDPSSLSGCLVPIRELSSRGIYPPDHFRDVLFTGNHELAIRAVDRGLADAAAVHSIVWEFAQMQDPDLSSRLKVIWASPAYGVPPLVVPATLNQDLRERLRHILLNFHETEVGRQVLSDLKIVRFSLPDPGEYDTAVELYRRLRTDEKVMSWLSTSGL